MIVCRKCCWARVHGILELGCPALEVELKKADPSRARQNDLQCTTF